MNKKYHGKTQLWGWVLKRVFDTGLFSKIHQYNSRQITVLNYHRIVDSSNSDFFTFKPNVSASPQEFLRQMEYVKKFYTVISIEDLVLWLRAKKDLPPHSLLITFDDGYYDNLEHAYPILKGVGFSAVIFLATNYMGSNAPFFWDLAAYCAFHTKKNSILFPNGEYVSWQNDVARERVVAKWVQVVKYFDADNKKKAIDHLIKDLDVAVSFSAFDNLHLNWDQVRTLSNAGIGFGGHTASHPILTKIPIDEAEREIASSKARIESEIKKEITSFAYPNGGRLDFSPAVIDLVKKVGYEVAFTLLSGTNHRGAIHTEPYRVRRIYVGRSDTLPRFAAKLAGIDKASDVFESIRALKN